MVCVLRCDIIVFAAALVLYDLFRGVLTNKETFTKFFVGGVVGSIIGIVLTIGVDSYFWGRLLWPELEMFWFNTYHNRSHEWGVSPFHWYFSSALPKALSGGIPLVLVGLFYRGKGRWVDVEVVHLVVPAVLFVFFYSFLPHKELRFVFPALVMLNAAAAIGLCKIHRSLSKSLLLNSALKLGFLAAFLASLAFTAFLTYCSFLNYPGGQAMTHFNQAHLPQAYVHVDVYPAMTGVTRFLYENEDKGWRYNRTEHLSDEEKLVFTHLFTDRPTVPGFNLYFVQTCFDLVDFRGRQVLMKDCVFIHERADIKSSSGVEKREEKEEEKKTKRDEL